VELIVPDRIVTAFISVPTDAIVSAQSIPTGIGRLEVTRSLTADVDGVDTELDIDIAIIDTGIDKDHPDLNVAGGINFYNGSSRGCSLGDEQWHDTGGHGTHVAGIAAARDNGFGVVGVAPGARLWAVKVLGEGDRGFLSCVMKGVDWVTAQSNIEVANMSLGTLRAPPLCLAVQRSIDSGVIYTAAAGNLGADAKNFSPANCSDVITVSAIVDTDGLPGGVGPSFGIINDDTFASFSNFGSVVDIAAPGFNILSTDIDGTFSPKSGTSMAAPHVAGAVALFKVASGYNGSAQGNDVMAALVDGNWTIPQADPWGFSGDPDSFPEPLITVGGGIPTGGNRPPQVAAGADQTIVFPGTVTLAGITSDDGLPSRPGVFPSYSWAKVSGPGIVSFDSGFFRQTKASFSEPGIYFLRLKASDSELTASSFVKVTVETPTQPFPGTLLGQDDFDSATISSLWAQIKLVWDGPVRNAVRSAVVPCTLTEMETARFEPKKWMCVRGEQSSFIWPWGCPAHGSPLIHYATQPIGGPFSLSTAHPPCKTGKRLRDGFITNHFLDSKKSSWAFRLPP